MSNIQPLPRRSRVMAIKFSISVPLELWREARDVAPHLGTSHLVQVALATFIETRKRDDNGQSPDGQSSA